MNSVPTGKAISPDSGVHWSEPGAWQVEDGIYRIPLPLPMDGLKAINVYVIETAEGLSLIDGGWAITEGRDALQSGLKQIGFGFADIRRFLVTHIHRDHYSLAATLGTEFGSHVYLGLAEKDSMDMHANPEAWRGPNMIDFMREAGAHEVAALFENFSRNHEGQDPLSERYPDTWLEGDMQVEVGERTIDAIHTPGHTQGHYVFADQAAGVMFAGDHVLPTITPSIGFEPAVTQQPLADFLGSLARVRALPDMRLLPAHGPVAPSTHARADELTAHHEQRLAACLAAIAGHAQKTSSDVAHDLPWTRHEHTYASLDPFNQGLAVMETKAHLELLVARGQATRTPTESGVVFAAVPGKEN